MALQNSSKMRSAIAFYTSLDVICGYFVGPGTGYNYLELG